MDYRDTPEWKSLELTPLNLDEIPTGLQWCIYPEERKNGVLCPMSVYMTVLALRWILTYTDPGAGLDEGFDTWKVYWKSEGRYGFTNQIFLFREKAERYDYDYDEIREQQPLTWVTLATLRCNNGKGVIDRVATPGAQPYGGTLELQGKAGVRRLLEDAMTVSEKTHNVYPITRDATWTSTMDTDGGGTLRFKLEGDYSYVAKVDIEILESRW